MDLPGQIIVAFGFGTTFLVALLVLAIRFPHPTPFQYNVFRIVLSLAAAGTAAMIPGFINIQVNPTTGLLIRAGGALTVFVIAFFFNPAQLALKKQPETPGDELETLWPNPPTIETLRKKLNALSANQWSIIEAIEDAEGLSIAELTLRLAGVDPTERDYRTFGASELMYRCRQLEDEGLIREKSFHLYLATNVKRVLGQCRTKKLRALVPCD